MDMTRYKVVLVLKMFCSILVCFSMMLNVSKMLLGQVVKKKRENHKQTPLFHVARSCGWAVQQQNYYLKRDANYQYFASTYTDQW